MSLTSRKRVIQHAANPITTPTNPGQNPRTRSGEATASLTGKTRQSIPAISTPTSGPLTAHQSNAIQRRQSQESHRGQSQQSAILGAFAWIRQNQKRLLVALTILAV